MENNIFDILENDSIFNDIKRKGESIDSMQLFHDLAEEAHVLIGGQTGSGKSVILNNLIYDIISTKEVGKYGIILCDPKRVEFRKYNTRNANKKFLIDYCNTPRDILAILQACEREMDRRYKLMERHNLEKYVGREIFIVIDEIADLMLNDSIKKEFVRVLQRLLQLARACKMHVICASQQIRAEVLPTKLTCNFTGIVGLKTRNKLESRLIIGQSGCEELPRYGECIYTGREGIQHVKDIPYIESRIIIEKVESL